MKDIVGSGLPAITPEDYELKESGTYEEARRDLMRSQRTKALLEQRKYLADMAEEMRLSIIPKREHREQLRKVQAFEAFRAKHPSRVVRVNGYKIKVPTFSVPKRVKRQPKKPRKPHPIVPKVKAKPKKKRRKNHTQRTGKTMRKLRKVKGVKVFSFPDHIWKVRK